MRMEKVEAWDTEVMIGMATDTARATVREVAEAV
jgi:hypothetical protein